MRITFRADSSIHIGTGHIMRCLTLAHQFQNAGAAIRFICQETSGHLCDWIEENGFLVERLPDICDPFTDGWWEIDAEQTADRLEKHPTDWLIVDHYAIDYRWEKKARKFVSKIMVIDDLANRLHDCDILLDQNFYERMETRYDSLVPSHCLQLLGPHYALLRQEFRAARKMLRKRDGRVQRILLFFGGSDPTNETMKAVKAIECLALDDVIVDVVVGASNPHRSQISEICRSHGNLRFHCQINNMAELMGLADLAIGAGGSTTWERCALGLPAITVTTAQNQLEVTQAIAKQGCVIHLGTHLEVSSEMIAGMLQFVLSNPGLLVAMSEACLRLMDSTESEGIALITKAVWKGAPC